MIDEKQIEIVALTFYETMYPGQKWSQLARNGSVKAVMLKAAEKAIAAIVPPTDLFGHAVVEAEINGWPSDYQEQFWAAYPHKVGKADARKALDVIHKKAGSKRPAWPAVMLGLARYVEDKPDDRPWCNPGTWIRQQRWMDEPAPVVHNGATRGNGFAAIAAMRD